MIIGLHFFQPSKKKEAYSMAEVSIFSFFAGCGILDLAFETSNFNIVFVNEFSPVFMEGYQFARGRLGLPAPEYGFHNDSAERYSKRKGKKLLKHLVELERNKGKLVGFIGGPPCPDFSVGGKNAGASGENGRLTKVYFDIICRCQPDFFVFENVKGLIKTEKHKSFYHEMKCKVQGNGYVISDKLLNAIEYGVPQSRERIIMIGVKTNLLAPESAFIQAQENLLSFPWTQNRRYRADVVNAIDWPEANQFIENGVLDCPEHIPVELTVEYWFDRNQVHIHPNGNDVFRVKNGYEKINTIPEGDTRGKSFKRLHRWKFSPTAAYGHNEVHLHPYFPRRISVAEAMAIQSLPAEFVLPERTTLSNKFKMIGNGVPYLMARAIAQTLMSLLDLLNAERGEDNENHN